MSYNELVGSSWGIVQYGISVWTHPKLNSREIPFARNSLLS